MERGALSSCGILLSHRDKRGKVPSPKALFLHSECTPHLVSVKQVDGREGWQAGWAGTSSKIFNLF